MAGAGSWVMPFDASSNKFDTRGTFVFDPAPGVTSQTLLAFAPDNGLRDYPSYTNNTAIGMLDVRAAMQAGGTIDVISAAGGGSNVVYTDVLLVGEVPGGSDPGQYFTASDGGPVTVYYNYRHSDLVGEFPFRDGNGRLLSEVPPGTVVMIK